MTSRSATHQPRYEYPPNCIKRHIWICEGKECHGCFLRNRATCLEQEADPASRKEEAARLAALVDNGIAGYNPDLAEVCYQ